MCFQALLAGYTTCLQRIIKFASKLDFFSSLSAADRRSLLLCNADAVVNIRSARLLRPGINLQVQLKHAVAGEGVPNNGGVVDVYKEPERLEYKQVSERASYCTSTKFEGK